MGNAEAPSIRWMLLKLRNSFQRWLIPFNLISVIKLTDFDGQVDRTGEHLFVHDGKQPFTSNALADTLGKVHHLDAPFAKVFAET